MNKNMIIMQNPYGEREKYFSFKDAYEKMKHYYTNPNGDILWEEEEWNDEYNFEEMKAEFERDGGVEFCDSDYIVTLEYFIEKIL